MLCKGNLFNNFAIQDKPLLVVSVMLEYLHKIRHEQNPIFHRYPEKSKLICFKDAILFKAIEICSSPELVTQVHLKI